MIKINLLTGAHKMGGAMPAMGQEVSFESLGDEQELRKQGLMKLMLIILPIFALYIYERMETSKLTDQRAKLTRELKKLEDYNSKAAASVKEIMRIREDEQRIEQRINALEKLSRNRTIEIKMLKLIADVIPERAWLTRLEIKGGRAIITGFAMGSGDVNVLAERLKSNILVADLQLVRINEEKYEGQTLTRFEFSCLLEGNR